jgi:hypothetical protein
MPLYFPARAVQRRRAAGGQRRRGRGGRREKGLYFSYTSPQGGLRRCSSVNQVSHGDTWSLCSDAQSGCRV